MVLTPEQREKIAQLHANARDKHLQYFQKSTGPRHAAWCQAETLLSWYLDELSTPSAEQKVGLDPTERFGWQPIEVAPRESGVEILGVRIAGDKMLREPFISFWSPTLNKFYCDPTHYILMPRIAALPAPPATHTRG